MSTPARQVTRSTTFELVHRVTVSLGPSPKASHLPKLCVIRKTDGIRMLINEKDWGINEKNESGIVTKAFPYTAVHYEHVVDWDPDADEDFVEPEKVTSLYTRQDLETMVIADLKLVPEFSRIKIPDRNRLKVKDDYVEAILAQRLPTVVSEPEPEPEPESEPAQRGRGRKRAASGE